LEDQSSSPRHFAVQNGNTRLSANSTRPQFRVIGRFNKGLRDLSATIREMIAIRSPQD
jgi:hypothetical protein